MPRRFTGGCEGCLRMWEVTNAGEEEKRLFLREEMSKHNTYLAAAAKNAGVQDGETNF